MQKHCCLGVNITSIIDKGNADIDIADMAFGFNNAIMPYRDTKFLISPMPAYNISFFLREFIESDLVSYAKENPHVAIYLKPRRHRSPVIVAEYCESSTLFLNFLTQGHSGQSNPLEVQQYLKLDFIYL